MLTIQRKWLPEISVNNFEVFLFSPKGNDANPGVCVCVRVCACTRAGGGGHGEWCSHFTVKFVRSFCFGHLRRISQEDSFLYRLLCFLGCGYNHSVLSICIFLSFFPFPNILSKSLDHGSLPLNHF